VAFPNVEGYDEDGGVVPSSVSVPLRSPPSGMVVLGKKASPNLDFACANVAPVSLKEEGVLRETRKMCELQMHPRRGPVIQIIDFSTVMVESDLVHVVGCRSYRPMPNEV